MTAIDSAQLLANVCSDALAHHEASPAKSLVLAGDSPSLVDAEEGAWVGAYLDWQRAGEVVALALELAGETVDGRPLFTIPARLSAPPETAAATADASGTSAVAHSDANLIGRVMGTAREVYPVSARRHQWLLREIRRHRPGAVLADLQSLDDEQLATILSKLEAERHVLKLRELGPGAHRNTDAVAPPADEALDRASTAFAQLRAEIAGDPCGFDVQVSDVHGWTCALEIGHDGDHSPTAAVS